MGAKTMTATKRALPYMGYAGQPRLPRLPHPSLVASRSARLGSTCGQPGPG